jgi:zinc transport system ATP-binding protein
MIAAEILALSIRDLTVQIAGRTLIDSVSFDIAQGSTAAIIGPNGAGKSVLLKSIMGFIPKSKGSVSILGVPHDQLRTIASDLSYIPQRFSFDPDLPLTVQGLFTLRSTRKIGMRISEIKRMKSLLTLVGMKNHLQSPIGTLSGGQLQRALVAYSLMLKPKLLILDEPAAGIDVEGQETIYSLLERIKEEENLTLLLVSHELDVVMRYADQVICLNKNMLCAGKPHEVLSNELLSQMYGGPVQHFTHIPHSH